MRAASAVVLLAILVLVVPGLGVSADTSSSTYVHAQLYVNTNVGYANSSAGDFTNPGPELNFMDNQTLVINLYAVDNNTHYFYIDMDGDGNPSSPDWMAGRSFDRYD